MLTSPAQATEEPLVLPEPAKQDLPWDVEIDNIISKVYNSYSGLTRNPDRYSKFSYPNRLIRLSECLRDIILREAGDIKQYIELQAKVFLAAPEYRAGIDMAIWEIAKWLADQMDLIKPVTPERNVVVISYLVFGKDYIDKMLSFNFKSLMAFENLPCLAVEKRVVIYIQTDSAGRDQIEAAPITTAIKALGVHFDYTIGPDGIIKYASNRDIAYWLLGAGASLSVHYAKSLQAAFHHSYPDIVYSNKFFSEMLRLSKDHNAIVGAGMRSNEVQMIPAITPYEVTKHGCTALSIPANDLVAHHLNSLHAVAWPMMVNNRPAYWLFPESHVMIWESQDILHFNTPHVMAYWLEYEVIKQAPERFYHTLDSEMDFIIKGEEYYMIQDTDEAYQAELSPPDRQHIMDIYTSAGGACNTVWNAVQYRDTVKFFCREMRVKINRTIRPHPANLIVERHVEAMQRFLYNTLVSSDPYAGITTGRPRTHVGYIFE